MRLISSLIAVTILTCFLSSQAFEPTSSYTKTNVAGFKIYLSSALNDHAEERTDALAEFVAQVSVIRGAVPETAFAFFQTVPIWLEWRNKTNGAAEYHPSVDWLKENGYNPEKEKCIEINNARNFVAWARKAQPSMLLHELAHSFHDQILGWSDPDVLAAFRRAVSSHQYDSVAYVDRRRAKAYALTDEKEFFAEISEAYFGKNDFYPVDRESLRNFDPVAFRLMQIKWIQPPRSR